MRDLSDAEAEDAAITENLQREGRAAARGSRCLQAGPSVGDGIRSRSLVGKFGKSEAYIRSRLKLCEIDRRLGRDARQKEEISVGVATEIAKYPPTSSRRSTTIISPRGVTTRGRRRGSRGDRPAALRALYDQAGKLQLR